MFRRLLLPQPWRRGFLSFRIRLDRIRWRGRGQRRARRGRFRLRLGKEMESKTASPTASPERLRIHSPARLSQQPWQWRGQQPQRVCHPGTRRMVQQSHKGAPHEIVGGRRELWRWMSRQARQELLPSHLRVREIVRIQNPAQHKERMERARSSASGRPCMSPLEGVLHRWWCGGTKAQEIMAQEIDREGARTSTVLPSRWSFLAICRCSSKG